MAGICVKVEARYKDYMDFIVSNDETTLYRYEATTGKMRKLFGFSGYGKAVRGNARKAAEDLAKVVFEQGLPFGFAI